MQIDWRLMPATADAVGRVVMALPKSLFGVDVCHCVHVVFVSGDAESIVLSRAYI